MCNTITGRNEPKMAHLVLRFVVLTVTLAHAALAASAYTTWLTRGLGAYNVLGAWTFDNTSNPLADDSGGGHPLTYSIANATLVTTTNLTGNQLVLGGSLQIPSGVLTQDTANAFSGGITILLGVRASLSRWTTWSGASALVSVPGTTAAYQLQASVDGTAPSGVRTSVWYPSGNVPRASIPWGHTTAGGTGIHLVAVQFIHLAQCFASLDVEIDGVWYPGQSHMLYPSASGFSYGSVTGGAPSWCTNITTYGIVPVPYPVSGSSDTMYIGSDGGTNPLPIEIDFVLAVRGYHSVAELAPIVLPTVDRSTTTPACTGTCVGLAPFTFGTPSLSNLSIPFATFDFANGTLSNRVANATVTGFSARGPEFGRSASTVNYYTTTPTFNDLHSPAFRLNLTGTTGLLSTTGGLGRDRVSACARFYLDPAASGSIPFSPFSFNGESPLFTFTASFYVRSSLAYIYYISGGTSTRASVVTSVTTGAWNHYCVVADGSAAGVMSATHFVNGAQVYVASYSVNLGTYRASLLANAELMLPSTDVGWVDDISLYDGLGDGAWVATQYATTMATPPPTATPTSAPTPIPTARPTPMPTYQPVDLPTPVPVAGAPSVWTSAMQVAHWGASGVYTLPYDNASWSGLVAVYSFDSLASPLRDTSNAGYDLVDDMASPLSPVTTPGLIGYQLALRAYDGALRLPDALVSILRADPVGFTIVARVRLELTASYADLAFRDGAAIPTSLFSFVDSTRSLICDVPLLNLDRRGALFGASQTASALLRWSDPNDPGGFRIVVARMLWANCSFSLAIDGQSLYGLTDAAPSPVVTPGICRNTSRIYLFNRNGGNSFALTVDDVFVVTGASASHLAYTAALSASSFSTAFGRSYAASGTYGPNASQPVALYRFTGLLVNDVWAPWPAVPLSAFSAFSYESFAGYSPQDPITVLPPVQWTGTAYRGIPGLVVTTAGGVGRDVATLCYDFLVHTYDTAALGDPFSLVSFSGDLDNGPDHPYNGYQGAYGAWGSAVANGSLTFPRFSASSVNGTGPGSSTNTYDPITVANLYTLGVWTQLCVAVDGRLASVFNATYYINGSQVASVAYGTNSTFPSASVFRSTNLVLPTSPNVYVDNIALFDGYLTGAALTSARLSLLTTVSPTASPSLPPTAVPSVVPTALPTAPLPAGWTAAPSYRPSAAPSVRAEPASPTATPTLPQPTAVPTSSPTAPTVHPTSQPTAPTASPTAAPSAPTSTPTSVPTSVPTPAPSASPVAEPTAQPTAAPTEFVTTATAGDELQVQVGTGATVRVGMVGNSTPSINYTLTLSPPTMVDSSPPPPVLSVSVSDPLDGNAPPAVCGPAPADTVTLARVSLATASEYVPFSPVILQAQFDSAPYASSNVSVLACTSAGVWAPAHIDCAAQGVPVNASSDYTLSRRTVTARVCSAADYAVVAVASASATCVAGYGCSCTRSSLMVDLPAFVGLFLSGYALVQAWIVSILMNKYVRALLAPLGVVGAYLSAAAVFVVLAPTELADTPIVSRSRADGSTNGVGTYQGAGFAVLSVAVAARFLLMLRRHGEVDPKADCLGRYAAWYDANDRVSALANGICFSSALVLPCMGVNAWGYTAVRYLPVILAVVGTLLMFVPVATPKHRSARTFARVFAWTVAWTFYAVMALAWPCGNTFYGALYQ